jgi:hypothetical protein
MTSIWTAVAAVLMGGALAASEDDGSASPAETWPPTPERIALLPPVEFNLEEDTFASEPIADADPKAGIRPPRRGGGPFGAAAPVSIGGFWAAPTPVVRQPGNLGMNAQFARVAAPLVPPKEGEPLWIGIGKFGRLELSTDAILPDSDQPVPDQLWLVETGLTHIRPLARGGTLGGTFLFGSASDRPFAAGRDLTLMAIRHWLGAGIVELGGLDAIGFAGGIGENSPLTRAAVVAGLGDLGIAIDAEKNTAKATGERAIHAASSRVAIWVIPTNEELIVARQARDLLAADRGTANGKGA